MKKVVNEHSLTKIGTPYRLLRAVNEVFLNAGLGGLQCNYVKVQFLKKMQDFFL